MKPVSFSFFSYKYNLNVVANPSILLQIKILDNIYNCPDIIFNLRSKRGAMAWVDLQSTIGLFNIVFLERINDNW